MLKLIRNDLYRVTHSFWNLLLFFVFIMCLIYFIVTISFSEMISIDSLKDKDILTEKTTLYNTAKAEYDKEKAAIDALDTVVWQCDYGKIYVQYVEPFYPLEKLW